MINHTSLTHAAHRMTDTYLALRLSTPVELGTVVLYSSICSSLPLIFWSVADMLR